MTLCILLINKKSLKPSILNGFQAFYSQKVSKTEFYPLQRIKSIKHEIFMRCKTQKSNI
jgi:hypothetical protein